MRAHPYLLTIFTYLLTGVPCLMSCIMAGVDNPNDGVERLLFQSYSDFVFFGIAVSLAAVSVALETIHEPAVYKLKVYGPGLILSASGGLLCLVFFAVYNSRREKFLAIPQAVPGWVAFSALSVVIATFLLSITLSLTITRARTRERQAQTVRAG